MYEIIKIRNSGPIDLNTLEIDNDIDDNDIDALSH